MNWMELKKKLVAQNLLSTIFTAETPTFALNRDPGKQSPYLPRHADILLRDVAAICDRMTIYLNEWREMEIAAVKAATERHVFLESEEPNRKLIIEQLGSDLATKRAELASRVAKAFEGDNGLGRGFSMEASARGEISQLDVLRASRELELHKSKWKLARDMNDAQWSRHSEHGNAHNFVERAEWAMKLLREEGEIALTKAESVSIGAKLMFGIDAPSLPKSTSVHSFVENMVLWTREMLRRMEVESLSDQDFEFTIPLTQKVLIDQSTPMDPASFKKELQNANSAKRSACFAFPFPVLPVKSEGLRIREIAVTFSTESDVKEESGIDRTAQRLSYAKLYGILRLPPQKSRGDPTDSKPTLLLGNIHAYSANSPPYSSSKAINNADCAGEWELEIFPLAVYQSNETCPAFDQIGSYKITDLRLHIRGVCKP